MVPVPKLLSLEESDTTMNETDFDIFNEPLRKVHPIFDEFCVRHKFMYVNRHQRYPRIRIERSGLVTLCFDLGMELDKDGSRFKEFRRDLPYEFSAGAYTDMENEYKKRVRFAKVFTILSGQSIDQIAPILQSEMDKYLVVLETWDAQYLKENGMKIQLRAKP